MAPRSASASPGGASGLDGRNTVVLEFVQWLRDYNDAQPPLKSVGFYGIDLYSLFTSMEAVLCDRAAGTGARAGSAKRRPKPTRPAYKQTRAVRHK